MHSTLCANLSQDSSYVKRSYISGQIIAKKYVALGTAKFVRASLKDRILESSKWWIQGFEGGSYNVAVTSLPAPNLGIPIGPVRQPTIRNQNHCAKSLDRQAIIR